MVATALASGIRPAAARIAAPPRLWPIKSVGAPRVSRRWSAARTRSATLDEKVDTIIRLWDLLKMASKAWPTTRSDESIVVCLSGRGDKDVQQVAKVLEGF